MAQIKNIVILGGSYGGISTAHYLLQHIFPKLDSYGSHMLILISASSQAMCRPACPRAMIADSFFPQNKLFVEIERLFEKYGTVQFQFVMGTVTKLDDKAHIITVSTSEYGLKNIGYSALVVATGASIPSPLLGINQNTEFLRGCWEMFRQALPATKNIVIAGGGPAGVEVAGELGEHLNGRGALFTSRKASPAVHITVVTAGSVVLPGLQVSIGVKAEKLLARLGVAVLKNTRVLYVTPEGAGSDPELLTTKTTIFLDDGKSLEADIYIPATGTIPNTTFVLNKALLSSDLRLQTNPATLRVDKAGPGARLYAVGDVSTYARPAIHNVLSAVPVLCENIGRDMLLAEGLAEDSLGQDKTFREDKRDMQLVPIGRAQGVGAAIGYALPSFLVWLIKGRDYWLWTTGGLWSGKKWAKTF